MAPLSTHIATAMLELGLESRDLSGNSTNTTPTITTYQGNTLQCLALTFATISVASSILAFYWFIKMRRSFRHE
jgi:G protein-coupled receptor GPR1